MACGLRAGQASTRGFDPDEFQHLHGGWALAHGLWPYRDYFEHHTPWLHLALVPLFWLLDVDHDPDDAVALVLLARAAMWIFATVAVALTFRLAQAWRDTRTGWVAAALLSTTLTFVDKTVEIRPDVPALACLLGSWLCVWGGRGQVCDLRSATPIADSSLRAGARWRLFAGGALLGAAVLLTQKALFAVPATAVLLVWWTVDGRQAGTRRERARGLVVFAAGAALPIALTLALFAAHTGVAAFVHSNVVTNAGWPVRFSPIPMMRRIALGNPAMAGLALIGLLRTAAGLRHSSAIPRGDAWIVLQTIALLAGAFVIPTPQAQYFLMVLPLLAVLAGRTLIGAGAAAARVMKRDAHVETAVGGALAIAGLLAVTARPLVTMVNALHPARPKAQDQLARMRLVLALTAPGETVMDGFTGAGVFRPHAYDYFFLHDEIRARLGAPEIGRLRVALRDGEIAPAVVLFDDDLRALPDDIPAFLAENYEPAGDALVWKRKDLALDGALHGRLDVGGGPSAILAGRGWSAPFEADGLRVRRTQGQRSTLRLPLHRPADLLVTVHARAEGPDGRLGLVVNDTAGGDRPVTGGWSDYAFRVPRAAWREGVNRVRLTHDGPALLVDSLRLAADPRP